MRLPRSHTTHEVDRRGRRALREAFESHNFVVREERESDYGVDFTIELKLPDGSMTNYRFLAQLKATQKYRPNKDGSVSIFVPTSNLNYLVRSPCSIYILYVAETDQLLYKWVHQALSDIIKRKGGWQNQRTVTVRFRQKIGDEALDSIYATVEKSCRLFSSINSIAARSVSAIAGKLIVDPDQASVTSVEEAKAFLKDHGLSLSGAGYGKRVLQIGQLVPPSEIDHPTIALVLAYAAFQLGAFFAALEWARLAARLPSKLPLEQRSYLVYLRSICNFLLGRTTEEQYIQELEEISRKDGATSITVHAELEKLKRLFLSAPPRRAEQVMTEIVAFKERVDGLPAEHDVLKIDTEDMFLWARGILLTQRTTQLVTSFGALENIGLPPGLLERASAAKAIFSEWQEWLRASEALRERAKATDCPLVLADVIYTQVSNMFSFALFSTAVSRDADIEESSDVQFLTTKIPDLETAISVYERLGMNHVKLKSYLLKCGILEYLGDSASVTNIANEILESARAEGYQDMEKDARDILEGRSIVARVLRREPPESCDVTGLSDEDLHELATDLLELMRIPHDRHQNVLRELEAMKFFQELKRQWCAHIDMHEDLSHSKSRSTLYAVDPERVCICQLHGYESRIPSRQPDAIVNAFKRTYCATCQDRSVNSRGR